MLPTLRQPEFHNGDRMSREEFLQRWEQIPDLKNAELIEGVVYLSSPVSRSHGSYDSLLHGWLHHYAHVSERDLEIDVNTTLLLGESSFQPDLAVLDVGYRKTIQPGYLELLPILVVEICYSSRSYDLGPKLAAYRSAGLREYVTVLLEEKRVEWRVLNGTRYRLLPQPKDHILRSPHLNGLWLDTQALFPPDRKRLFAAVDRGLAK